jgi:Novel STAND NTPase 1/Cytochrome c554 and c-prime
VSDDIASQPQACPSPGLRPFLEKDADIFFGRDQQLEQLLQRLASHRLLAVVGVSGSGKSSLIRAGVVPILRHGMAEHLPARWRILLLLPGGGPLAALDRSMRAEFHLPAEMARTETSFYLIDCARSALAPGESLLVIVDQFEELFRFRREALERDGGNEAALFVNLLLNAADQREVPIYVILTMRSDHLGECAQFRGLPEALNDCQYLVPRMTRRQQQEAIEGPLAARNIEIQPALVQKLLNDAADDPDHLPVLQHLLKRLWEEWQARGATGPITLEDYRAAGYWENAMDRDLERVFEKFADPAEQQCVERMFRWITSVDPGGQLVRQQRSFSELLEVTGLSRERLAEVIQVFEERGFLYSRAGDDQDRLLIDLTHESVMWHWPRLNTWIAEEAETAARLRFILESARTRLVLTGSALDTALKLKGRMDTWPLWSRRYLHAKDAEITSEWINDCRKRRSRRRLFSRTGTFLLLFVIVGSIYYFTALRQLERQKTLELAKRELEVANADLQLRLSLPTGSGTCSAPACHGGIQPRNETAVLQNEYSTWVLRDKHAQAYTVLTNPVGTRMAKILGLPKPDTAPKCLACHALDVPVGQDARTFHLTDGVGCENCHGPASAWLGPHTARDWKYEKSLELGMYNTRDLVKRSEKCLSCHFGTLEKFVDRDMIAAGHADLSFELASFSAVMPPHWKEPPDYDKDPWGGVKAWGTGQAVQLREALRQLARSAARPGNLRWDGSRYAVFRKLIHEIDASSGDLDDALSKLLGLVRQLPGDRTQISSIATSASDIADRLAHRIATAQFDQATTLRLMQGITDNADGISSQDERAAEQAAMALQTIFVAYTHNAKLNNEDKVKAAIQGLLQQLEDPSSYNAFNFARQMRGLNALLR